MSNNRKTQTRDVFGSQLSIETKKFLFDLKENQKGQYLRITEISGGRSSIVIPVKGLKDFQDQIQGIIDRASKE